MYAVFEIAVPGAEAPSGQPLMYPELLGVWRCEAVHVLSSWNQVPKGLLPLLAGMPGTHRRLAQVMTRRYGGTRGWQLKGALGSACCVDDVAGPAGGGEARYSAQKRLPAHKND